MKKVLLSAVKLDTLESLRIIDEILLGLILLLVQFESAETSLSPVIYANVKL